MISKVVNKMMKNGFISLVVSIICEIFTILICLALTVITQVPFIPDNLQSKVLIIFLGLWIILNQKDIITK